MDNCVYIIGDSRAKLWGLSGKQRLRRMLHNRARVVEDVEGVTPQRPVLLLRGDYVFDNRLLSDLLASEDEFVLVTDNGVAAARTNAGQALSVTEAVLNEDETKLADYPRYRPEELASGYDDNLKKKEPPLVLPITEQNRELLEKELFAGSYKGVTDLVTKWLWPLPARNATRFCARHGILPNHVTLTGLALAILAGLAFWYGYLGTGLILAWIMTFLDTVDGKLARVTVTSSRFGDIFDHGIDLVHPPLWYLAWGVGLSTLSMPISHLVLWMWVLFFAYVGGRLCEGAFQFWAAPFSLFIWRRLDSFNRLITARRNPNLIFLTVSLFAGRPDLGFYAVTLWHVVSTAFLASRLVMALYERRRSGPLQSWLADVDPVCDRRDPAVRVFTRLPAKALMDR